MSNHLIIKKKIMSNHNTTCILHSHHSFIKRKGYAIFVQFVGIYITFNG